jgi:hypothetical protein
MASHSARDVRFVPIVFLYMLRRRKWTSLPVFWGGDVCLWLFFLGTGIIDQFKV